MAKRAMFFSLAIVLVFAMVNAASAKPNVADTTKKGSLLVFPKIETFRLVERGLGPPPILPDVDTYVFIGNDNVVPVYVKCYWMDNNQTIEDFQFPVTANQPVYFSARDGYGTVDVPPFWGVGSLVCFADDAADSVQVKFNHLYGNALIRTEDSAVVYNAYAFAMPGSPGTAGQLVLDGNSYDACPQYLVENFIPSTIGEVIVIDDSSLDFVRPDLSLWPCKQDLRQDRIPTCTKAKFDVWNEDEVKFTGAYQCFKCFLEVFLDEIGTNAKTKNIGWTFDNTQRGPGFGWEKFTYFGLDTYVARLRVQGIASTVCDGKIRGCKDASGNTVKTINTPLLGVLLYAQEFYLGGTSNIDNVGFLPSGIINSNNAKIVQPFYGSTLHGAGAGVDASTGGPGLIQWDPGNGNPPEAPAH